MARRKYHCKPVIFFNKNMKVNSINLCRLPYMHSPPVVSLGLDLTAKEESAEDHIVIEKECCEAEEVALRPEECVLELTLDKSAKESEDRTVITVECVAAEEFAIRTEECVLDPKFDITAKEDPTIRDVECVEEEEFALRQEKVLEPKSDLTVPESEDRTVAKEECVQTEEFDMKPEECVLDLKSDITAKESEDRIAAEVEKFVMRPEECDLKPKSPTVKYDRLTLMNIATSKLIYPPVTLGVPELIKEDSIFLNGSTMIRKPNLFMRPGVPMRVSQRPSLPPNLYCPCGRPYPLPLRFFKK